MMTMARESGWLRASKLSWLLLYMWLLYSAAMLWKLHIDSGGIISMCIAPR